MGRKFTTISEMEYDNYPAWRRHSPWVYRLVAAAACEIAAIVLMFSIDGLDTKDQAWMVVGLALGSLVASGFSLFFFLTSLGKMRLAWRAYRRANGHYTRAEQQIVEERQLLVSAQYAAAELAGHLLSGSWTPMAPNWSMVLNPQEQAVCSSAAHYARFYGTQANYMHSSAFFMGRPSFVAVGMAATALGNSVRRRQAQAYAQAQWREQQVVAATITNQRVLCQKQDGTWLSFYFDAVTNIDADANNGTLILQFHNAEPLMLGGRGGLFAAVVAIWALHGPAGLRSYPGLQNLRMLHA